MTRRTRAAVASSSSPLSLSTRETVVLLTVARAATWAMVIGTVHSSPQREAARRRLETGCGSGFAGSQHQCAESRQEAERRLRVQHGNLQMPTGMSSSVDFVLACRVTRRSGQA